MIPAKKSERELTAWIQPRLDVIQHSIRQAPLSPELREGIRAELEQLGLLGARRPRHGRLLRSQRHERRGPGELQRRGPEPHDLQPEVARRHLRRLEGGVGVAVRLPVVLVAPDAHRRPALGAAVGRDPRVRALGEVGRPGHRRPRDRRADEDAGRDVGRRRRGGRRNVGGDAALGAGPGRARDGVQVAVASRAAVGRVERDRCVDGARSRARAGRGRGPRRRRPAGERGDRAREGPVGGTATVGHGVRLRRREALALPVPPIRRQRRAEERLCARGTGGSDGERAARWCRSTRGSSEIRPHRGRARDARDARGHRCACGTRRDGDRVGRQRAAAGRLLPLVRAVLLRRLRAAHAGPRARPHRARPRQPGTRHAGPRRSRARRVSATTCCSASRSTRSSSIAASSSSPPTDSTSASSRASTRPGSRRLPRATTAGRPSR